MGHHVACAQVLVRCTQQGLALLLPATKNNVLRLADSIRMTAAADHMDSAVYL